MSIICHNRRKYGVICKKRCVNKNNTIYLSFENIMSNNEKNLNPIAETNINKELCVVFKLCVGV